MKVYNSKEKISETIFSVKAENKSVGFVPTMGALHAGHLALVSKALEENDIVVVSVFVNPTQFDKKTDLEKYPRTLKHDINLLKALSKNNIIIFAPSVKDIYGEKIKALNIDFDGLENEMEGKFRPGHFDGVGTVVKRLFEIVNPDNAYFGEKDFQQLQIIKKLVEKFHLSIHVIGCEIYREESGLAMSSRNERLSLEQKNAASAIFKILKTAKEKFASQSAKKVTDWVVKEFTKHKLLELEYFMISDVKTLKPINRKSNKKTYRAFIAVFADEIRLIDNIALN
ncbi:MAG: pantoate--beta-alanine ligase [Flavobacteriaceae bacterium]|nr:pantoate--beta-alanine ligase [Flavobacteriaceae bacterium]